MSHLLRFLLALFTLATSADEELIHRKIEEAISTRERSELEAQRYIEFATESGVTEKAYLAPTQYVNNRESNRNRSRDCWSTHFSKPRAGNSNSSILREWFGDGSVS